MEEPFLLNTSFLIWHRQRQDFSERAESCQVFQTGIGHHRTVEVKCHKTGHLMQMYHASIRDLCSREGQRFKVSQFP